MRALALADMESVRGGLYTAPTPDDDGGGGDVDVGGGYLVEQQSMDTLQAQVDGGTDATVTTAAESIYNAASSARFTDGSGAYYFGGGGGSPPPSFRDIYNSIPGVPKDKVRMVKLGSFKIC